MRNVRIIGDIIAEIIRTEKPKPKKKKKEKKL